MSTTSEVNTSPWPGVPAVVVKAIAELFETSTGDRVIDVAQESDRLLKAIPGCGMSAAEIGEAIVRESVRHSSVAMILNGRAA